MSLSSLRMFVLATVGLTAGLPAAAQATAGDTLIIEAREASRRNDRPRLANLRQAALDSGHALAPWADYWELKSRLKEATVAEVEAMLLSLPEVVAELPADRRPVR